MYHTVIHTVRQPQFIEQTTKDLSPKEVVFVVCGRGSTTYYIAYLRERHSRKKGNITN